LINTKINKFLEDYKVDNIKFKQNQTTKSKSKSNQENENSFYFTTIYVGNPSLKFQKHIKPVFQKYNIEIKPTPVEKYQTILTTKANARKLSMRMSSTNILVLKIRTFPTWERHPDNFCDESKTTKDPTNTAQYFSTYTTANPVKTQTSMTILKF